MAATYTKCTWIRGSHFFHPNIYFMNGAWTQVSNTSWMFNTNHGGDKMLLMGSTTSHRDFHIDGIPQLGEQVIALVRTKDITVYARGKTTSKTTLQTSLVLIWFENSPHSNQRLDKMIGPLTDHRDQSMKYQFSSTHTYKGYPFEMN